MCLKTILQITAQKPNAYSITALIEPSQCRLLTISTQGDFLGRWIHFVLHNCSLNFEIKNLYYTTDSFCVSHLSWLIVLIIFIKYFTDCMVYISIHYSFFFFNSVLHLCTLSVSKHLFIIILCLKAKTPLRNSLEFTNACYR